MLESGKKIRDKKNKYSNSRVVRKKNSEQNKNHNITKRKEMSYIHS